MRKIRTKLIIYFLIPTVTLFVVSYSLISRTSLNSLKDMSETNAESMIIENSKNIENSIRSYITLLNRAKSTVETLHSETEKNRLLLLKLFNEYLKSVDEVFSLWVLFEPDGWDGMDEQYAGTGDYDETGNYAVWAYREPTTSEIIVSSEAWGVEAYDDYYYRDAFTANGLVISAPYEEEITDAVSVSMISLSIAVKNAGGEKIGVIGIDVSIESLTEYISELNTESGQINTLSSSDNSIIAGTSGPDRKLSLSDIYSANTIEKTTEALKTREAVMHETLLAGSKTPYLQIINTIKIHYTDKDWILISNIPMDTILDSIYFIIRIVIVANILVLALFILIIFMISKNVSDPLTKLRDAFSRMASGDLASTLNIKSTDETGQAAASFNEFSADLGNKINTIKESVKLLEKNSIHLEGSINNTNKCLTAIRTTAENVNDVSHNNLGGTENATKSVEEIQSNIAILEKAISEQDIKVHESSAVIEEMLANIRSVADISVQSSSYYSDLMRSSQKGEELLAEVVETISIISDKSSALLETNNIISNIASQTNLLSMNAAIEAAHAGAAGKGFAVVADEIRKLAENSSEQSKAIEQILTNVVTSIDQVVKSSKDAGANFGEILSLVERVSRLEVEVKNSLQEQSAGSMQILSTLEEMKTTSGEAHSEAGSINNAVKSLAGEINTLNKGSRGIKQCAEDVTHNNTKIIESVVDVQNLIKSNAQLVAEVENSVSIFRYNKS